MLCAVPVNAQDSKDYLSTVLSKILQAVQKNVDSQKMQMVNLSSREEITIEEYGGDGKIQKTTNIISDYRVFPKTTTEIPECRVVSEILESFLPLEILREEREVLSVKENDRIVKDFKEPFWARGSSFVDFFILFDKQNEECFDYELVNSIKVGDRSIYVIEIKQKKWDVGKKARGKGENISWEVKYEGAALIDARTMEIIQLNRGGVNISYSDTIPTISRAGTQFSFSTMEPIVTRHFFLTQYEYDKIKIRDHFLTLPVAKTVNLYLENGQLNTVYKSRYSDHKMFTVEAKISFDTTDETDDPFIEGQIETD